MLSGLSESYDGKHKIRIENEIKSKGETIENIKSKVFIEMGYSLVRLQWDDIFIKNNL